MKPTNSPLPFTLTFLFLLLVAAGCAPIEYSVIVVDASQVIAEAEAAGAACTEEQLTLLSPTAKSPAPQEGTALVSSEETAAAAVGAPMCAAPYEYFAAVEYLKKAREEVGFSEYQAAIDYAREARTQASKARDIALNRTQERGR